MTYVEELAAFIDKVSYNDLTEDTRQQLKLRVLDSIGCCIGALGAGPIPKVKEQVLEFGGIGHCTLIGLNTTSSPDRSAFYNGALLRYLDFMDNYMGKAQSCHPSDNFASVLAAAEYQGGNGKDLMAALALAYGVLIKLIDSLPAEQKGFDHTLHLAYSMTAGISKVLGLEKAQTANALAIAGTAFQGLVTTRSGYLSQWKGLASANLALDVVNSTFLAKRGITGPLQVLEGSEGIMRVLGEKAKLEWSKDDLQAVQRTSIKKYNAEVHSQSAIEGLMELRRENHFAVNEVDKVDVVIFKQAYNIIGGGEEAGDKYDVHSKEQADHSLPYILAVAILDGDVTPQQYLPERIEREDVQTLIKKVQVRTQMQIGKKAVEVLDTYTARYPQEMPCKITVSLKDGRELIREQWDYEGFFSRPMSRDAVVAKFTSLTGPFASEGQRSAIIDAVDNLEKTDVRDLTKLLMAVDKSNRTNG